MSKMCLKFADTCNRGPDVDEFGNPLDDILSTDTTRLELSAGVDDDIRKCPRNWYQFQESCYWFARSPIIPRDEARYNCRVFSNRVSDAYSLCDNELISMYYSLFASRCVIT